jgi:hypothetical protein
MIAKRRRHQNCLASAKRAKVLLAAATKPSPLVATP